MMLGMTHWASGDLEAADRVFADYTLRLRAAGNLPDAISATAVLADIKLALGRLREAVGAVEQLLQFVRAQGEPMLPDAADLHRTLSELYLEEGDLETAAQHLQISRELSEKAQLPVLRYRLRLAQARLKAAQADLEGALVLLEEAERLYIRTPLPDFCPIPAMKARIWVMQGRLTETLEWAQKRGLSVDDAPSYLREFEHLTLARVLIARYRSDGAGGSIQDAAGLLERLLEAAEAGQRTGSVIEILVLQALAHEAQGKIPAALAPLGRALTLAGPEGYVRLFVDEGAPMAQLLSEAAAREIRPGYTGKLLAAFQAEAQPRPGTPALPLAQPLVEPLSQRELEILQLIAQGLSNREISERLFLAVSTVKGYNQNIFAKLQVQSRTEALARARALGLL
jgi:LuxR family maltose regulon positive regulatory protein